MSIEATLHNLRSVGRFRSVTEDVLGQQSANGVIVADGAISTALATAGFYRIVAVTACRVRFGAGLANAANGEHWPIGRVETRYLDAGTIIAVDALA